MFTLPEIWIRYCSSLVWTSNKGKHGQILKKKNITINKTTAQETNLKWWEDTTNNMMFWWGRHWMISLWRMVYDSVKAYCGVGGDEGRVQQTLIADTPNAFSLYSLCDVSMKFANG